jgi:hypothetical protein
MPFLGDARTLSFPEVSACLLLGWLIVLTLPNVHRHDGANPPVEPDRQLRACHAGAVLRAARGAVPVFSVLMRRIPISCFGSLLLYGFAFGRLLVRPLTLGALNARIEANLAVGQTIHRPKLVILAGSNGPYSHRCETISRIIGWPCVNAGVAVGIALDYSFARWKPRLQPGDIVYLPLEEAQYLRPRDAGDLGPAIMLRHDRATLQTLPLHRRIAALFAGDLRAAIMSLIETALADDDFNDPCVAVTGGCNEWGDHVGHTAALAALNTSSLAAMMPFHPSGAQIRYGYGSLLVVTFIRWAEVHGVRVIGGLPTGFIDSPLGNGELTAIRAVFRDQGAEFLETPEAGRYPRSAFFDTPERVCPDQPLSRRCQSLGAGHGPETGVVAIIGQQRG